MSDYKFETLQLHVGQETADPATGSGAFPIYVIDDILAGLKLGFDAAKEE